MTSKLSFLVALVLVPTLAGCAGDTTFGNGPSGPGTADTPSGPGDPYAPCTDKEKCCTSEDIVCTGDPDNNPDCKCTTLWDCSENPNKCTQDRQEPTGGGSWTCEWTDQVYTCKGNPKGSSPPGGTGWSCTYDASQGLWTCTKQPPNPTNTPGGTAVWKCTVDAATQKIVCVRQEAAPAPDAGAPAPAHEGNCDDGIDNDGDGKVDCEDRDCPPCQQPTCPAGQECCDGKDNDGDGKIDEGNVCAGVGEPCPPGAYQSCDCYCGVHRKCNPDGTWGPCTVDGDNSCKVAKVTSHSQCGFGICDYGECVPGPMYGWQCKTHTDCPTGKVCDLGECIKDIYFPCP